ncbi:MAG: NADP-dependent oxidoreductase [Pseudomonadota bacterium]
MPDNRQIIIDSLPTGPLEESNYALRTDPAPEPGDGEILCRTLAITIGAGQRAGLQGSASYAGAPQTGIVMGGTGVARVEKSNSPAIAEGSLVTCPSGWQDYSVHTAKQVTQVEAGGDPAHNLGVLGTNGLTAYFGLLEVGLPKAGETVLVSAAAGSVGHIVGQIAKVKGCTVVGIAGTNDKCKLLTDKLGFDAAINYRSEDFRQEFKEALPNRIDIYFDNTGGDILGSALRRMNTHGRIVCCGVVSQYDTANPQPGPRGVPGLLVNNRVRMEGFLVFDFLSQYADARKQMSDWIASGELTPLQDEFEGLESAPRAFVDLLAGGNVGTRIVRVAE